MLRTHTCGELNQKQAGQDVVLCGWVDRMRDIGQLFFLTLRDRYGVTQCVCANDEGQSGLMQQLRALGHEYCVRVHGTVRLREPKDVNLALPTGAIEVLLRELEVLNPSEVPVVQVRDQINASDELRLKYRYLDLRRQRMQRNLETRHRVIQAARSALVEMGFLELETPLLVRSTPEGARDFVVPSRLQQGKFYALPQSPQLYKQMLMISGFDRYFQFAPAFRDEDLRADRLPVHTQIDMEMTFVEERDVFAAVETYMARIFSEVAGVTIERPLPIMSYAEAMERYGCDKPEVRFGLELKTVTELAQRSEMEVFRQAACVRCLTVPDAGALSRKDIDELTAKAKIYGAKGLAWTRVKDGVLQGGVGRFWAPLAAELLEVCGAGEGALLLFVADRWEVCCAALAAVRLELGRRLKLIDTSRFAFLWVNRFPLFEWNEERKAYDAMHHLFTQPLAEDLPLLASDPGQARGLLYDLVLNGVELLSGSIRINRPEIQQQILDIVQMPREEAQSKFGFLMEAFKYGAPPHGGSAVGLDRLVALLCGEDSIREVIAYPCNTAGVFPLDGSPAVLEEDKLVELGMALREKPAVKLETPS